MQGRSQAHAHRVVIRHLVGGCQSTNNYAIPNNIYPFIKYLVDRSTGTTGTLLCCPYNRLEKMLLQTQVAPVEENIDK